MISWIIFFQLVWLFSSNKYQEMEGLSQMIYMFEFFYVLLNCPPERQHDSHFLCDARECAFSSNPTQILSFKNLYQCNKLKAFPFFI